MFLKADNFYLFLFFASVLSSFVFCIGFFPYATVHKSREAGGSTNNSIGNSKVNRTILMIVDALRLDFIESESFSYLHQLLDKREACFLKISVDLPTVTKPRIKVSLLSNDPTHQLLSIFSS